MKYSVNIILTFLELFGSSDFLYSEIKFFQLLKPKTHGLYTGSIKSFVSQFRLKSISKLT